MDRVTVILLLAVAMLPGCGSPLPPEQSAQQTASVAQVPQTTPVADNATIDQPVPTIALPLPVASPRSLRYPPNHQDRLLNLHHGPKAQNRYSRNLLRERLPR